MSARKAKQPEWPVTISSAARLTPTETDEARDLKRVCDAADGLDLKVSWGGLSDLPQVFMARAGDELVGYCSLDGDGAAAELCGMVAPAWRRRGVGLRLFEAARLNFRDGGGEQLYTICEDASPAGRAFVDALSMRRASAEYRMELRARDLPPDDGALAARKLEPGDQAGLAAYARITAAAFQRPLEPTLRHAAADLGQPAERLYLASVAGEDLGAFKLYSEDGTTGIYGFAVETSRQREGWGRHMLARACALARELGAERVTLEVDTDNERAIALYSSSGFVTITTFGYYLASRSLIVAGPGVTLAEDADAE